METDCLENIIMSMTNKRTQFGNGLKLKIKFLQEHTIRVESTPFGREKVITIP